MVSGHGVPEVKGSVKTVGIKRKGQAGVWIIFDDGEILMCKESSFILTRAGKFPDTIGGSLYLSGKVFASIRSAQSLIDELINKSCAR